MNDCPRRIQSQKWSHGERAIQNAVDVVEMMGADIALTDAVVLLGKARARVADYVDTHPENPQSAPALSLERRITAWEECLEPIARGFQPGMELNAGSLLRLLCDLRSELQHAAGKLFQENQK